MIRPGFKSSPAFAPSFSVRFKKIAGGISLVLFAAFALYYGAHWLRKPSGAMMILSCLACAVLACVGLFYIAGGLRSRYLYITPVSLVLYHTDYPATDIRRMFWQKKGAAILHIDIAKRPWLERSLRTKDGWFRTVLEAVASFFVILFWVPMEQERCALTFLLALGYFALRRFLIFIKEDLANGREGPSFFPVLIPPPCQAQKETLLKELKLFADGNCIPFYKEF